MQIGLPITGKYRDPESDQYYNNNNVSSHFVSSAWMGSINCVSGFPNRVQKSCKPPTLTMNTCWAIRSRSSASPRVCRVRRSPG